MEIKYLNLIVFCMFYQNMDIAAISQNSVLVQDESLIAQRNYLKYFKGEEDLEKKPLSSAKQSLQTFLQKGGTLHVISHLSESPGSIRLQKGDAVYPICSGGWCRSQTLWAILHPFSDRIVLFPPHAARSGWDPYNGQVNRYKNYTAEAKPDAFYAYFGIEKPMRFGFEHAAQWEPMERSPTEDGLQAITQFYDEHYFGPNSSWQGKQGDRRIYIAFSYNAQVVFHRLNQANKSLENVTVIAINAEDLITHSPAHITPRSIEAYGYFYNLLNQQFDFTNFLR